MSSLNINRSLLQSFVPLNALSAERLDYLLEGQEIEALPAGTDIFHLNEEDGRTIYLLSGALLLTNEFGDAQTLDAGDIAAAHAVAPEQPRRVSAKATSAINILRIDSKRLDRVLAWDQSTESLQKALMALQPSEDGAWISQLLQSRIFYRLPPANVIELFKSLTPEQVQRGQVVLKQGARAECCYFIKRGVAEVIIGGDNGPVTVALLEGGQYFGEEGLLIEGPRNADVVMASDGVLMRLDKADFDLLLKSPSLALIDFDTALAAINAEKMHWLDVRLIDEQARGVLHGALCLPLQALRIKSRLLPKEKRYVVYCDTGRRSAAAAFLLGVMGFDAQVLEGGLRSLMPSERDRFLVDE